MARVPADWFARETFPLLVQYCRHVVSARRIRQPLEAIEAEKGLRLQGLAPCPGGAARECKYLFPGCQDADFLAVQLRQEQEKGRWRLGETLGGGIGMSIRLLVCSGRDFNDDGFIIRTLNARHWRDVISALIDGDARDVDRIRWKLGD